MDSIDIMRPSRAAIIPKDLIIASGTAAKNNSINDLNEFMQDSYVK